MAQEQEPIRFTEVTIDDSGQPAGYHLGEIPVEPLTDQRLTNLPFRQRMDILRDMQNGYTYPELTRRFRFELTYVSPVTLNLAKTIVNVQNREWEVNHATNQRTNLQANYETEKQGIRRGEKGSRGIEKKIQEAATAWKRQDETLGSQERTGRVLKDTVLDMFIHDLFMQPDGPEKFLIAVEDLISQSTFTRSDVSHLLAEASFRLKRRQIPEDASFFAYKEGVDHFIQASDAKLLGQILEAAFPAEYSNNPLALQTQQLAIDVLDFSWRNCNSLFGENEKTPQIAFLYDLLFTAYLTQDFNIIEQTTNFIWKKLEEKRVLSKIEEEFKKAIKSSLQPCHKVAIELQKDRQYKFPTLGTDFLYGTDPQYMQKWDPTVRHCFYDTNFDRCFSLASISQEISHHFGKTDYFSTWFKQYTPRALVYDFNSNASFSELSRALAAWFPNAFLLDYLGDQFTSRRRFFNRRKPARILFTSETTLERQDAYNQLNSELKAASQTIGRRFIERDLLFILFSNTGIEDWNEMKEMTTQNKALFRRIINENLWFVAENGDQYDVQGNPELSKHSIKSLTFYPNPHYSGWRIDMATELLNEDGDIVTQTYDVDRNGQLFNATNDLSTLYLWIKLPIERLILERLYFITSGALGQREAHKGEEREETKVLEVRRSHWRKLTSTPDRIYTLTSEAARRHAGYVLQTYGIDIYQENLRRRASGTLGSQEYMTFVRAVQKQNMEPNQIIFDPSLLVDVA